MTNHPDLAASDHPRIQISGLEKSFGSNHVLRGLNLDVPRGDSVVVIGPSGCGKSVTVKCVLGLLQADSGRIHVDGCLHGRRQIESLRARSGMLFQGAALFDSLPVWKNVAFRLLHSGTPKKEAREIAIDRMRRVGLDEQAADLLPAELSGGMQKRAGLARAIAANPEILFFDEPTAGLDPILAKVVSALIRRLVTESGATALTITHDLTCAEIIGDRAAMLYDGRVQWNGPVQHLRKSGNPHVEQFVSGDAKGPIATLR